MAIHPSDAVASRNDLPRQRATDLGRDNNRGARREREDPGQREDPMRRQGFLAIVLAGLVFAGLLIGQASAGVLFESTWSTALGTSQQAWTDGGKWTWATSWDFPPTPVMQVVTGGPSGLNALRLTQ